MWMLLLVLLGGSLCLPAVLHAGEGLRVVALAPSVAEIISSLDCGGMLVGRSRHADWNDWMRNLPDVGPYSRPSVERILLLKPDICIGVEDGTPPEAAAAIAKAGIAVERIAVHGVDDLPEAVRIIAGLLGADARGEQLAGDVEHRILQFRQAVDRRRNSGPDPRVLFLLQESPFVAAAEGTFIGSMIRAAGGVNAVSGMRPYPVLGREDVLRLQADVVIFAGMAAPEKASQGKQAVRLTRLVRPGGRAAYVNADDFTRPSLRSLEALEALGALLYPAEP